MIREHCLTRPERVVESDNKGKIKIKNKTRINLPKRKLKEEKGDERTESNTDY